MTPAISVIVPNYNHAPYLAERIESVLAQSYQNFELILLDDCSTDDSRAVLERYRHHPKVSHVVLNEQNSGTTFRQWAKGIELACHEWVWIAESDDWCEPTLLATLVAGLTDTTCLAYCQSVIVRDNDVLPAPDYPYFQRQYAGAEFIEQLMLEYPALYNASMAIFKKSCYESMSRKFTEFKFCGDWLFWILVARQGSVSVSGKRLNYFRKHDADVTGRAKKQGLLYQEYIKLAEELRALNLIDETRQTELLLRKFNHFLLVTDSMAPEVVVAIKQQYYHVLAGRLQPAAVYKLLGIRNSLKVSLDKLHKVTAR